MKIDIEKYKEKEESDQTIYKPNEYVKMSKIVQQSLGMPGLPLGYSAMAYGLSDSGKTALMLNGIKNAQDQGILPIVIITENKLDLERVKAWGIDPEQMILKEDLDYLEEVYNYISQKIKAVINGDLPYNTMIFWDSVAATPSVESMEIDSEGNIKKKYGPQKNAAVIGYYNPIIAKMISNTRKMECPYTVGLFMLNQAYVKPAEFPGGMATIVPNGGEKIWFPLSLTIEMKEGRRLDTTINGTKIDYAMVSKIKVKKNHINNINTSGEIVIAGSDILENDPDILKDYKDEHKDEWAKSLKNND